MDKNGIIERLERLAGCAIHTIGELPFVMSLDDGIAVHEVIDMLRSQTELIRCKDCKYFYKNYCIYSTRLAWSAKNDDFCSRAERREDG